MQADDRGLGLVEKVTRHRLADIHPQFIPRIPLRENVVRKTFGHEPAIGFLSYGKNDFHADIFTQCFPIHHRKVEKASCVLEIEPRELAFDGTKNLRRDSPKPEGALAANWLW